MPRCQCLAQAALRLWHTQWRGEVMNCDPKWKVKQTSEQRQSYQLLCSRPFVWRSSTAGKGIILKEVGFLSELWHHHRAGRPQRVSFPHYQQIFGTRSLIYFSVVVLKISWQKQLQFKETVHSIGEIKAAAAWSGWRYRAHCQEADFKKCCCSPLVFTDIVRDPVTVRKCRHSQ